VGGQAARAEGRPHCLVAGTTPFHSDPHHAHSPSSPRARPIHSTRRDTRSHDTRMSHTARTELHLVSARRSRRRRPAVHATRLVAAGGFARQAALRGGGHRGGVTPSAPTHTTRERCPHRIRTGRASRRGNPPPLRPLPRTRTLTRTSHTARAGVTPRATQACSHRTHDARPRFGRGARARFASQPQAVSQIAARFE
jgi:hypothetical protein